MDDEAKERRFEALLFRLAEAPSVAPAVPADLGPGDTVDRYRLEARLGQGGMGVVYKAFDTRLDRSVALKVLPRGRGRDDERRRLLLREARSAAAVSDPSIAAIHDVGEGDVAYIAMEYVEGRTLREVIDAEGPLGVARTVSLGRSMAAALGKAHRLGVVHRDFKPDNVMVTEGGGVKLLDFGLARSPAAGEGDVEGADHSTLDGCVVGTRPYQSPEQRAGRSVDARTDVYSLGVTLHEMLSGRPPKRPADGPRPSLPRSTPPWLAALVRRCTSPEPGDRFADGVAVASALELGESAARRARRRVGALAAAGLVASAAALWLLVAPSPSSVAGARRGPPLRRLTAMAREASITHAALSPDGRAVAYTGEQGLVIVDVEEGSSSVEAVRPGLELTCPRWFPDSRTLLVRGSEASSPPELWVLDAAGEARSLGIPSEVCGAVSPSGTAVAAMTREGLLVTDLAAPGRRRRFTGIGAGAVASPLVWSPDGRFLAVATVGFDVGGYDCSIRVLDTESGAVTEPVRDPRLLQETGDVALAWAPDGRLVFGLAPWSPDRSRAGLLAVALDGAGLPLGEPAPFAPLPDMIVNELSIDAAGRVAMLRWEIQADVYVAPVLDGGLRLEEPRRLVLSDRNERPSGWAPDGRALYVVSDVSGRDRCYLQPLDEPLPRPLLPGDAWTTWPVPVPGTGDLLFWRLPDGVESAPAALMRLPYGGAEAVEVLRTPSPVRATGHGRPPPRGYWLRCAAERGPCLLAVLQPEGRGLAFYEVDLDGRRLVPSFVLSGEGPAWDYGFALSHGGTLVAVSAPGAGGVRAYTLDGAKALAARLPEGCEAQFVEWTADDQGLFATAECTGESEANRLFSLAWDGPARSLWTSRHAWFSHPILSPDASRLAFAVTSCDGDVWLLDQGEAGGSGPAERRRPSR